MLNNKKVILASASPRRKEILKLVGINFIQIPADVDETILLSDHSNPKRFVKKITMQKCKTVYEKLDSDCIVIAADTIVYSNKKILGKPKNQQEAIIYLKQLSGKKHIVYTGIAIAYDFRYVYDVAKTYVTFKNLSDEEISEYISCKEPMDKAGAYGIQGLGAQFVENISGCYFNVMGLPINIFYNLISSLIT